MNITYNTAEERLKLPHYGRLIQSMVGKACKLTDRRERQTYAEKIVTIMISLNPQMRSTPNYEQTCWNHLAFISDYQLDIDYPCPIDRETEMKPIHRVSYPNSKIQYRHYGLLVENVVRKLCAMPADSPDREYLISRVAACMKRNLSEWKEAEVENDKIARDLAAYTDGQVSETTVTDLLCKNFMPQRSFQTPNLNNRPNRRNKK